MSHVLLQQILTAGSVHAVHQPLVDIHTRVVLAHEALMRGPAGALQAPLALLRACESPAELATLDALTHASALEAVGARTGGARVVFLNIEPRGIDHLPDGAASARLAAARAAATRHGVEIVSELTERALLADPAAVLRAASRLREQGDRIALDDVGATPDSLAFLPLVRPDVVKLDIGLIRDHGDPERAAISSAVRAYAEESGAEVVAEGIETEADHHVALALGASIGQGWLHGRPGALTEVREVPRELSRVESILVQDATPYELVSGYRRAEIGAKQLLQPISRSIEAVGAQLQLPPLVLGCFQDAAYFTPATARRYEELAARAALVCAVGRAVPPHPAPGVRGTSLHHTDPLAGEWNVIVLGAHYSGALIARDLGDTGADHERRFSYVVTHDRRLVEQSAQCLVRRLQQVEAEDVVYQ